MIVHIQGRFKIAKYDRAVRSKNRSCTNDRIFLEILILNLFLVLKEWILKDKTASNHLWNIFNLITSNSNDVRHHRNQFKSVISKKRKSGDLNQV